MYVRSLHCSFYATLVVLFIISLIQSCASTTATKITGSWKDPEAKAYRDIFVAVLSKNLPARSTVELDITRRLKKEGVKATGSLAMFPHTEDVETAEQKKAAVEKIQSLGHDAIMTLTLIKHTEESRYVPGTNSYTPTNLGYGTGYTPATGGAPLTGTYGAFGGYYVNGSTVYQSPGYYEKDNTYFLETRLFDAKTSKLVWSAQSQTFNPIDLAGASSDISLVMAEAMKKAGLLAGK